MEDILACGIDAKHSNEDQIVPFDRWIDLYNDRIGLFGGIDVDILCENPYDEVFRQVLEKGNEFRARTREPPQINPHHSLHLLFPGKIRIHSAKEDVTEDPYGPAVWQ